MEIGLVIAGILVAGYVYWQVRKDAKSSVQKDIADKTIETLQDINAKIKKVDTASKSSAERLRNRKYRD